MLNVSPFASKVFNVEFFKIDLETTAFEITVSKSPFRTWKSNSTGFFPVNWLATSHCVIGKNRLSENQKLPKNYSQNRYNQYKIFSHCFNCYYIYSSKNNPQLSFIKTLLLSIWVPFLGKNIHAQNTFKTNLASPKTLNFIHSKKHSKPSWLALELR